MCGRYFFEYREGDREAMDIIACISDMQSQHMPSMKQGEIFPLVVIPGDELHEVLVERDALIM